jgi:hypothetical protein
VLGAIPWDDNVPVTSRNLSRGQSRVNERRLLDPLGGAG